MFSKEIHQNLIELLGDYGLNFINGITLDRLAKVQGSNASIPIIKTYNSKHSITKGFKGRTLMPLSAGFTLSNNEDRVVSWLSQTTTFPASWLELSYDQIKTGKALFDDKDIKINIFNPGL